MCAKFQQQRSCGLGVIIFGVPFEGYFELLLYMIILDPPELGLPKISPKVNLISIEIFTQSYLYGLKLCAKSQLTRLHITEDMSF